jgi:outer membrane cobalamin receptor
MPSREGTGHAARACASVLPVIHANAGVIFYRTIMRTIAFLVIAVSAAHASPSHPFLPDDVPPDSTRPAYAIGEVVITATRGTALASSVPSAVSTISRARISAGPGSLLSASLLGTPGLSIRAYGAGAAVQTLSLRGMAPEHTLVLMDGERWNSAQNGLVDFGLIPSSTVERVEIARGGYSALYGSDALGGVINIITRKSPESFSARVSSSLGSYGFSAQEAGAGGTIAGIGFRGIVRRERGKGDYRFMFNDGRTTTELRRSGEDFSVFTSEIRVDAGEGRSVSGHLIVGYTDADRGSPGTFNDISSTGVARLGDRTNSLRGGARWNLDGTWTLSLSGSARYADETYRDPRLVINGAGTESRYVNRSFAVSPEVRAVFSPWLSGTFGAELSAASLESNDVRPSERTERSLFLTMEHTVPLPWEFPFEMVIFPTIRYDGFSEITGDVSPRLGINIGVMRDPLVRVRASYGRSYRAPGFNDLYWKTGGNADLLPERAVGFDGGIHAEAPFAGILRLDASLFSLDVENRVVWIPGAGGLWSPRNIGSVRSRGFEGELSWTGFEGALTLDVTSTWIEVKKTSEDFPGDPTRDKKLVYVPPQVFSGGLTARIGGAEIVLQHTWTSYRYSTEMNDRFIPSYGITSGSVRYTIPFDSFALSVKGEVGNMMNTSYQVIALYPMPMREFRGTVEVQL